MKTNWQRVEEIFLSAVEHPPEGRAEFLRAACGADAPLREEVEAMLRSHAVAGDFLETPAFQIGAEALAAGRCRPGDLLGDCRILSLLGEGGMGEVYLSEDTALGRQVAVKVVRHGLLGGGHLLRQFQREERILARLNHPHIARLYRGALTAEGVPYFVMEYVEGERLDSFCDRRQLSTGERLALFRKVCAAVSYAHQHLVIHRDLKPANIRVTPEGEPKLLDFGIAQILDPEPTTPGAEPTLTLTLSGGMTPEYASPEQLRGERLSTASDLYSLGVILYELLTGQRPYRFKSRRPEEIARAICEVEIERPSTAAARASTTNGEHPRAEPPARLSRRLAGDLDNIALMAMRKEPARRYASVAQLSEDLRRHLEGLPVLARRDTWRYVGGKFIRRHRVAVAAGVLVLCTLLGAVVVSARQARVARQERDRARLAQAQTGRLNEFLQSLLGSANPEGLGRDVKVVQVLDAAARSLDRELAGQPELLAQAHLTIANAYGRLREAVPAEEHTRAALAIGRRFLGEDHPVTRQAAAFLARGIAAFRRYAEAEPLLRQALAAERRQPSADRNQLGLLLLTLSHVLVQTGRLPEAAKLGQEALARGREMNGPESAEVADAWNNLGNLRLAQNDPTGAEAAYRQAIAIHRRFTPARLSGFNPVDNLASLLLGRGELAEAESLVRDAEGRCRESLGENNATHGFLVGLLGAVDFLRQDYPAAVPKLQHALATVGPVYPPDDVDIVGAKALLGLSLTRTGRAAAGEEPLREALATGRSVSREGLAPLGISLEGALGECLLAQRRLTDAGPLLRAGYDELCSRLGADHPQTLAARRRLREADPAGNPPDEEHAARTTAGLPR